MYILTVHCIHVAMSHSVMQSGKVLRNYLNTHTCKTGSCCINFACSLLSQMSDDPSSFFGRPLFLPIWKCSIFLSTQLWILPYCSCWVREQDVRSLNMIRFTPRNATSIWLTNPHEKHSLQCSLQHWMTCVSL